MEGRSEEWIPRPLMVKVVAKIGRGTHAGGRKGGRGAQVSEAGTRVIVRFLQPREILWTIGGLSHVPCSPNHRNMLAGDKSYRLIFYFAILLIIAMVYVEDHLC